VHPFPELSAWTKLAHQPHVGCVKIRLIHGPVTPLGDSPRISDDGAPETTDHPIGVVDRFDLAGAARASEQDAVATKSWVDEVGNFRSEGAPNDISDTPFSTKPRVW
jgi:hypothetical protein